MLLRSRTFQGATFFAVVASIAFGGSVVAAEMANIAILAPQDGAALSSGMDNAMNYEITLGPGDDHFHVWVDGEKGPPQRALKGSYSLPKMTPGKHAIIVKVVDKAHVPTGPEKTIFVKVE